MSQLVAFEINRVYAPGHGPGFLERTMEFLFLLVPGVPAAGPFLVGVTVLYLLMVRTSRRVSSTSFSAFSQPTVSRPQRRRTERVAMWIWRRVAQKFG